MDSRAEGVVVTDFLCEDCNECGCVCPDEAIDIPLNKVPFKDSLMRH